ncbi:MAG: flagellar basal body-associated protein FliL [Pararhodobacter sp.]|nr:flagellar basal body-associated protein FliL [Pararhodobacter sp.]
MKVLIPLVLVLFGLAAGAGAGWFMRASATADARDASGAAEGTAADSAAGFAAASSRPAGGGTESLQLSNQFMVPLVEEERVRAVVVIGLALEMAAGHGVTLSRHEARLRAGFLQALFDHANMGGFEGVFTSGETLLTLRRRLRDIAREELGDSLRDVLITDLMRQEG